MIRRFNRMLAAAGLSVAVAMIGACDCCSKSDKSASAYSPQAGYRTIGSIERLDPALDELLAPDAKIELLADGFKWSEGPVWLKKEGKLVFSDIPNNAINSWNEKEGLRLYLRPAGYTSPTPRGGELGSNGLVTDSQGRLVLCHHGDRRIARHEGNGVYVTLADKYDGKRLNSPNDLVYKSNGDLYFTDPPYGLEKNVNDPAKELAFQGVYLLSKDGKVTLLTDKMTRPNGIALSPDEKTLYVAQSDSKAAIWMAYDVKDDGTIANGRIFYDVTKMMGQRGRPGAPDGMKVDAKGNLWATGPGGVLVFSPAGKHLGTILTTDATANCGFGGDGSMLYMTVNNKLCRIQTKSKGLGF